MRLKGTSCWVPQECRLTTSKCSKPESSQARRAQDTRTFARRDERADESVARSDRKDEAGRLALRCLEDAARAGISGQDLEAAAEGNLIGNMLQALDDAEFRRMYRNQVAEQEED